MVAMASPGDQSLGGRDVERDADEQVEGERDSKRCAERERGIGARDGDADRRGCRDVARACAQGGEDGRTTIFDYWGVPEHQKWLNQGKMDGARLSTEQKQLRDFYNEDTTGILLSPYSKLGDKIALGAWTVPDDFQPGDTDGVAYLATCAAFDEGAFSNFRDELRFRGPERFPPDSLEPGNA